jgi:hypothetical protein
MLITKVAPPSRFGAAIQSMLQLLHSPAAGPGSDNGPGNAENALWLLNSLALDPNLRRTIASSPAGAIAAAASRLSSPQQNVRAAAASLLLTLTGDWQSGHSDRVEAAREVLRAVAGQRVVGRLVPLLSSGDPAEQQRATDLLARLAAEPELPAGQSAALAAAVRPLMALLRSGHDFVRSLSYAALRGIAAQPGAVQVLCAASSRPATAGLTLQELLALAADAGINSDSRRRVGALYLSRLAPQLLSGPQQQLQLVAAGAVPALALTACASPPAPVMAAAQELGSIMGAGPASVTAAAQMLDNIMGAGPASVTAVAEVLDRIVGAGPASATAAAQELGSIVGAGPAPATAAAQVLAAIVGAGLPGVSEQVEAAWDELREGASGVSPAELQQLRQRRQQREQQAAEAGEASSRVSPAAEAAKAAAAAALAKMGAQPLSLPRAPLGWEQAVMMQALCAEGPTEGVEDDADYELIPGLGLCRVLRRDSQGRPECWNPPAGPLFRGDTDMCAKCGATEGAGGSKLKVCARCRAVHYCSAACQKAHWSDHRRVCGAA